MTRMIFAIIAILLGSLNVYAVKPTPNQKLVQEQLKHDEKMEKLERKLEKERRKRAFEVKEKNLEAQIVNERYFYGQPEARQRFELNCPYGGYEDVIITTELQKQYGYWRGGGSYKTIFRRPVLIQPAVNPYKNLTVTIKSRGVNVVENLCPGGSITLVQSLEAFNGGWYRQVIWIAEGFVDGKHAYADFHSGTLNQWDSQWEPEKNKNSWVMKLNRIDDKF